MEINLTSSSSSSSLSNISLDLKEDRERISDKIFWVRVYNDVISLQSVRVTIIVVYIIVILIATFGNIIVILVIYRRRSLRRNPAILLILNLTFCDLISCVVYRPLLLVELFLPFVSNYEVFHDQLDKCRAASYFQGLLAGEIYLKHDMSRSQLNSTSSKFSVSFFSLYITLTIGQVE